MPQVEQRGDISVTGMDVSNWNLQGMSGEGAMHAF
jgi:hypothetical protein